MIRYLNTNLLPTLTYLAGTAGSDCCELMTTLEYQGSCLFVSRTPEYHSWTFCSLRDAWWELCLERSNDEDGMNGFYFSERLYYLVEYLLVLKMSGATKLELVPGTHYNAALVR